MPQSTRRLALLASCALASSAIVSPAVAQETSASDTQTVEDVVVTGSRAAARSQLETAAPVDVLTGEVLAQAAAIGGELGAALNATAPSFNFPRQSNSGPADVVRAGQLRGMAPDQTLVLVNGRRRHPVAIVNLESKIGLGTNPVDFNAIPVSALSRAEVLRDGAGAQYGSDAIAGVINLILDDTPTGGELSATYGLHVTDFEPTGETLKDGETVILTGSYGWALPAGGFLRLGAEYKSREATERGGPGVLPFFENPTPANLATEGQVLYRPGDAETEQVSAFFNTEFPLAEGVEAYAFGTFDTREGLGTGFYRYPDGFDNIPSVYPDGYRPQTIIESDDVQLVGGLRGEIGGWAADASLNYGFSAYDFSLENSLNPSLGPTSPTSFFLGDYRFDLVNLNLDLTRSFEVGLASPLEIAWGVEYRNEAFETGAGDPASYTIGTFPGPGPSQAYPGLAPSEAVDIDRDVWGAYVEASAEVTDRLFLDAAVRVEDYSDFGDAVAGKLAGRYEVTDAFALRGSVSSSFRAPSLAQTGFAFSVSTIGSGGAGLSTVRTVPVSSPIAQALGAPELEAETSLNLAGGFVVDLRPNLSVTLDVFRIDVDDRIALSEAFSGVAGAVQAATGVAGVDTVNFFTNGVDTRTEGFDVVALWRTDLAAGRLDLSLGYSEAETEIRSVDTVSSQLQALGFTTLIGVEQRNTIETAPAESKLILGADYARGPIDLTVRATRFGEATRVFDFGGGFTPTQVYGAEWSLDAEVEWAVNDTVSVALGAVNLLDEYPDRSSADISYFENLPYDVLSPIGFNGAYWYGRLTTRF